MVLNPSYKPSPVLAHVPCMNQRLSVILWSDIAVATTAGSGESGKLSHNTSFANWYVLIISACLIMALKTTIHYRTETLRINYIFVQI